MTTTKNRLLLAITASLLVVGLTACGDDDPKGSTSGDSSSSSSSSASASSEPVIDPGDGGNYHPTLDPADFVDKIDNPYLPWTVGSRWHYEGSDGEDTEIIDVVVTDKTKTILGIKATVVRDTVKDGDGNLVEDTFDWYAQDKDGNVWYLGEDTKEYEDGKVVSTEGSWEAGVDGAYAGYAMLAHPNEGHAYRQEFDEGNAVDMAEVSQVGGSITVPTGPYSDILVIQEWTPLEPKVVEDKTYAPGVGLLKEKVVQGGSGTSTLTDYDIAD